jgi:hypothetical protein
MVRGSYSNALSVTGKAAAASLRLDSGAPDPPMRNPRQHDEFIVIM